MGGVRDINPSSLENDDRDLAQAVLAASVVIPPPDSDHDLANGHQVALEADTLIEIKVSSGDRSVNDLSQSARTFGLHSRFCWTGERFLLCAPNHPECLRRPFRQ